MNLFEELQERGLIEQITSDEVIEKINQGNLHFYVGFDPSADSLHIGQLAVFNLMSFLQKGGHYPIGLMGGATGMIGDPGGKDKERNLQSPEQIQKNIDGVTVQMNRFLDFDNDRAAVVVNNYDWLSKWGYLEFLRDVGKHFSVNAMMNRDSVKNRLTREGSGISYTEFSYMLLQSYDYQHLNQEMNCTLQLGGSDQWGNIVSGIDLIRRSSQKSAYGMTLPLILKSDGTKFGKSESGAVWLDANKTSPYEFYQYFINQGDEDVIRFLKVFTQIDLNEIKEIEKEHQEAPHKRFAQKKLAEELTIIVHGKETLDQVIKASRVLFGEAIEDLDDEMIQSIFKDVPSIQKNHSILEEGWNFVDALVESGACVSKGKARKLVESGGAYVNNLKETSIELNLSKKHLASSNFLILRTGKKNYHLVQFSA